MTEELERQLQELKVKTQNLSGIYIESLVGDHPAQRNWEKNHDDTVGSLREKLTFQLTIQELQAKKRALISLFGVVLLQAWR